MILVTGGNCQGKKAFSQSVLMDLPQGGSGVWCDGSCADWETFMKERYGWNFHLFVRRVMLGEAGALPGRTGFSIFRASREKGHVWTEKELADLASLLVQSLADEGAGRILVTDEIGCGIVPVEYFERIYREETGRICCLAASRASQVWRVCCGIGQRIK